MDESSKSVYPEHADYYDVLVYLTDEIKRQALDSENIKGVLDREFGITSETPEDVFKYVFEDLRKRFRTSTEYGILVFYKRLHDLEEYRTGKALSNLFG